MRLLLYMYMSHNTVSLESLFYFLFGTELTFYGFVYII